MSKFSPARKWDNTTDCQICGQRWFMSECRILDVYTGRGGLLTCPDCYDKTHYGFVPYTIRAEKPVERAFDSNYSADPSQVPQPFPAMGPGVAIFPPGSISPELWRAFFVGLDQIDDLALDELVYPWRIDYNPADPGTCSLDWSIITTDWSNILGDWATDQQVAGGFALDTDGDIGFPEFPSDEA